ncbi:sugar ABC transporter ATP-binding protein [Actinoplanes sp. NBRC 103695]|uniref:sugar ABC transporter ATP-binding protein n=1 Tax=Actinoplanes sp. NBRC 103695 TaxID=3032202 RepID=UPI0024A36EC6|nr:sugar ABC transporter ATP-binding protein [Actinoplanes sp. NBRC 103695]GLY93970.1 ribose ABC transporter [Actinoplanes sp. NBRC 103695]
MSPGEDLVRVDRLVKSFGNTRAVRAASFSVAAGEIHALCGHNGAGKSTVVKMLSGQEAPDDGAILIGDQVVDLRSRRVAQRNGVALVDQELSVVPSLTVAENLMLGDLRARWINRPRAAGRRLRTLLDSVGLAHVELDRPLGELGIGERQLIEIARALGQDARLVILDEPTATLSDVESAYVYEAIRNVAATGCAVLFVSHRLGEVLDLCDKVTVMRDGAVVATTPVAELTLDSLIVQMLGEAPLRLGRRTAADVEGAEVLTVSGLSVPGRVRDFSIALRAGRVYALAGQLGSGASDVLRAIAGLLPSASAELTVDGTAVRLGHPAGAIRAGIAFVSNDRKAEGLFLRRPVSWNLLATRLPQVTRLGVLDPRRWSEALAVLLDLCGLDRKRTTHAVGSLSGGNQQKVFVGRCLGRDDVRVLLLDDPTRGVDVGGRAAIHALLRDATDRGMAVLFSSTELEELGDLADVVVTMHQGEVVRRHEGDTADTVLLREMTHGASTALVEERP